MPKRLNNRNIAFVTSGDQRNLTDSDQLAAAALRAEGAHLVPAVWNDPSVDWTSFDAIIVRSTWDYHLHPAHFITWLDLLARQRLHVWNPVNILRWNMDKHYLLELEARGIPIPRTVFCDAGKSFELSSVQPLFVTDEVVVKPVVSASAWNTWRCSLRNFSNEDRRRLDDLLRSTGIMVQEFMPEISTGGEWSLMFFGDRFSHAVRKYPGAGDFRVQDELGGTYQAEPNTPADLIRQAKEILLAIEKPLLYARVDGIVRDGHLMLMELELVEPALFFDLDRGAVKLFCKRLAELIGAN